MKKGLIKLGKDDYPPLCVYKNKRIVEKRNFGFKMEADKKEALIKIVKRYMDYIPEIYRVIELIPEEERLIDCRSHGTPI